MFFRISGRLLGIAAAALVAAGAAQASVNLIANGSFETGDFSGWQLFGTPSDMLSNMGVDSQKPQDGTYGAYFGPQSLGGITQTVATTSGQLYKIDFWLANEAGVTGIDTPNSVEIDWNGLALWSQTDVSASGYAEHSVYASASGASTTLGFAFTNVPAFWDLDNVSIMAVPEPSSWPLALLGLAAVLGVGARVKSSRQTST